MKTSTATCNTTYTTRDGGSTLICTEPKGHKGGGLAGHGHYSDPRYCRNCGSGSHTFCNR